MGFAVSTIHIMCITVDQMLQIESVLRVRILLGHPVYLSHLPIKPITGKHTHNSYPPHKLNIIGVACRNYTPFRCLDFNISCLIEWDQSLDLQNAKHIPYIRFHGP